MIELMSSLHRLFNKLDSLVDERVGIIQCVEEVPKEPGSPNFFHYYGRACNTRAFCSQQNFAETGGASAVRDQAMAKAIGEAVERYCSAIYDVQELPFCTFDSAPFRCICPTEFALYSPEQYRSKDFRYVPFTGATDVHWMQTVDPITGELWHVPAAMIFAPYSYDTEHSESRICQPISTGLACHCSLEEATISALCEVVERDAFTITWQARLPMPQINLDSLSCTNRNLVWRFEQTGSSVTMLNITLDHGIPTILSVLRSDSSESPALVFAASADPCPEDAIRKSLEELAHTRRLAHTLNATTPAVIRTPDNENILSQADHVRFYCDHANSGLADFIFSSMERVEFSSIESLATGAPKEDLLVLIARIAAVGHRILVADLTTPDVGELGLSVVRAVIPGFHPLFMGHRYRALGGSRVSEIPQRLGHAGIDKTTGGNRAPHPYP